MIQVLVGLILVFVYPFLSKTWSDIVLLLLLAFTIVAFFLLDDLDTFFSFLLINIVLLLIGYFIRRFWQREKTELEMDELQKMYKDKKE
jgi:chromate transport protein ChrA